MKEKRLVYTETVKYHIMGIYLFCFFDFHSLFVVIIQILNMQQPKILVAIRKRPLSKKQSNKGETDIISVKNTDTVIVSEYKQKVDLTKFLQETIFNFDFAFDQQTHNEQIYQMAVRPLVDSAFQGAKVTCFAYGQTASGKTYTMNGNLAQGIPGLYTLGANDIFQYLASPQFRHLKAKMSFYQIYCGRLYDLLNKRTELKLREDNKNNINIIGLEEANVSSSEEFSNYLLQGSKQRVTSQNSANADSSRSHAILQISLKDGKKLFGKISFIDLAGNQRGADHMDMDKQTRIDGAQINKSLLSLKECIRALDQGKGHTPFRGSKLTMVLKDSFIGFCRTIMIGNVSPSSASSQNTLNTLRYADRVKQLRKPQEGVSKQEQKAKQLMLPRQNKNAIRIMINNQDDAQDIAKKRQDAQKQYGIHEQPPKKVVKEQPAARKSSFNAIKPTQLGKEVNQKSTSVAKNYAGNSLGNKVPMNNNLVGPNTNIMPNKNPLNNPNTNKGRAGGMEQYIQSPRPSSNFGMQRYNNNQQGMFGNKQDQMEIESPNNSPYYLPNKNVGNNSKFPQQGNILQQGRQVGMNQSQNLSANFSNLNVGNNMSLGPMNIPNAYGQPNRLNQGYNQPYQQQQQQQQQNAYQNNYNQPSYNPQNYNQQQYPANNYPQQNKGPNFQNNNFNNNYQTQNYNNNQNYPNHPNQQNYQLPQNWEDLVNTIASSEDPHFNECIVQQMNQRLFNEEQQLMRNHSTSLRRQIDIIKSEMSLLNDMQVDKTRITSRKYVRFMQDSIEQKLSLLQQLRQKLINFTYKLDVIEEIEGQKEGKGDRFDDEQLLDDIN